MNLKAQVLQVNTVNKNGRYYPKATVKRALRKARPLMLIFPEEEPSPPQLGNILGQAVLFMDHDHVCANCRLFDDTIAEKIEKGELFLAMSSIASIDPHGVIKEDLTFNHLILTRNPA